MGNRRTLEPRGRDYIIAAPIRRVEEVAHARRLADMSMRQEKNDRNGHY
jgi:hypothetical protein